MGTFSKSLASCGGFIAGPGRGDRLPARPVAGVHVHRLGGAGGRGRDAGRAADHPLGRGPRAAGAGARQRPLPAARAWPSWASTWSQPTPMPDGSDVLTPIVPVTIGDDWQAVLFWKALYDEGVYANVALYPAVPRGGALLRTSVMATHEREHLDRALEAFDRRALAAGRRRRSARGALAAPEPAPPGHRVRAAKPCRALQLLPARRGDLPVDERAHAAFTAQGPAAPPAPRCAGTGPPPRRRPSAAAPTASSPSTNASSVSPGGTWAPRRAAPAARSRPILGAWLCRMVIASAMMLLSAVTVELLPFDGYTVAPAKPE